MKVTDRKVARLLQVTRANCYEAEARQLCKEVNPRCVIPNKIYSPILDYFFYIRSNKL